MIRMWSLLNILLKEKQKWDRIQCSHSRGKEPASWEPLNTWTVFGRGRKSQCDDVVLWWIQGKYMKWSFNNFFTKILNIKSRITWRKKWNSLKIFKGAIHIPFSGKVNILGEHTDYNEGFVLPTAIDKIHLLSHQPKKWWFGKSLCCRFQWKLFNRY